MQMQAMAASKTPHIAIVPTPGMGHLIPLLELAKRLLLLHPSFKFSFTFIIPTDRSPSKAQLSVLDALPPTIHHLFLPPVDLSDLPLDTRPETIIALTAARSLPSLRNVFQSLTASPTTTLVALVVDLFGTDAFDVAAEFNVPPYILYTASSTALSLFLYLPKLHDTVSCEYRDLPDPVQIPGCIPLHGTQLMQPLQDRKNDAYKWVLYHANRYSLAHGIMSNSFMELELGSLTALTQPEVGKPPVYPIGPLVNVGPSNRLDESLCLKWLDAQPNVSVLFVSFGSGGTLSTEQLNELALGLEMSEQRFLWVLRSPNDKVSSATYFSAQSHSDPFEFLPKGYIERTRQGLVVPSWAPQAQVLSHSSTGGFLTHCGWNSILESVVNGVPLIAWPLYAEQKMNAAVLSEERKVAIRAVANENGVVRREEIAKVVRALMEGEEGRRIRSHMNDLKDAAAKALSQDGSSTKALSNLALKWTTHHSN